MEIEGAFEMSVPMCLD